MIRNKLGQRLMGVAMLAVSAGFIYWEWHNSRTEGYYHKAAIVFAAFAVFALGVILFPIDFERLKAEHGVDKPESLDHYPPVWKGILVVAIAAALGFWYLLANH